MNADARWQSCGKLQQLTIQKSDRLTKSQSVTVHVRFFFAFFPPSALQQLPLYRQTEHKNVLFPLSAFHFHPIALSFTSRLASSSESAVSSSPGCLGVGRNNVDVSRFTLNHGILAPTTVTLLSCFYFPRWPFIGNHN